MLLFQTTRTVTVAADMYTYTQTNTHAVLSKKTHSFTQKPIYRCTHMPSYSGRPTHTFMYTQINSHMPTHALTQSYTFIRTYIHKFTCNHTHSHSYIHKHLTQLSLFQINSHRHCQPLQWLSTLLILSHMQL